MIAFKIPPAAWSDGYWAGQSGAERKAPAGLTTDQEREWYDGYDCGRATNKRLLCTGRTGGAA